MSSREYRGEYIRQDGLTVPNQLTIAGVNSVLQAAFKHDESITWQMGLCANSPGPSYTLSSLDEPTLGVGGYERVSLPFDSTNWPVLGLVNGETYIESINCVFNLLGPIDVPVTRLFLSNGADVMSISSPIVTAPELLDGLNSYKYRMYFR